MARLVDEDIQPAQLYVPVNTDHNYIVSTHAALEMDILPTLAVDGVSVELGVVGSGLPYEAHRVSPTQTVIYIKAPIADSSYRVEMDAPIGEAVLGESFVIH
jgi:hypothetical protein